jgi:RND family efflux transporter MFP subunit
MKKPLIIVIIFCSLISFVSCGSKDNKETPKTEDAVKEEEHENPGEVTLTAEQMKTIGAELGNIEQKQLTASLKTNGVLKVPNQNKASINSVYSGVIKSLLVQPGNIVSKGQTIATIANPEFIQVQSEYLGINSKIVLAEQEYDRQKELNAGNAGALKNLQAAESNLKALRTSKSSLQQQIQLMGINPSSLSNGKLVSVLSVRSPISGVVSNVNVKMGSYVDVTTVVAEIVDNSQLHLDLFVYEKDLPKLKNNQTIHFTLTNNPGKEYDAQIFSLGSSFENESKAISVHALVQGDKTGLIDGMSITANISLDKATLPAIPTEAIVSHQGQDYIFIVDSVDAKNGTTLFKRIPVVKGTTDVGYSEITLLKDVPAGAKVVVKGAFFLLAKQTNIGEEE